MAIVRWVGKAAKIKQVVTLTVGSSTVGHTFITTINGKSYTYTAVGGDTTTTIATAILALLTASTEGEFTKVAWTSAAAVVTGTAKNAGEPFTVTLSGTGTYTLATPTANSSPSDVNNALNYSGGALPANLDDLYLDNSDVPLLWNLSALSGVTLTSLTIAASFTANIGLAKQNTDEAESFAEYRQDYWQIGATTITVGNGPGAGSPMIKLDTLAIACTINVVSTGASADNALKALVWKGTNAANALNIMGGSVDVAPYGGEVATIATLRVGIGANQDPDVRTGAGVTLTTVLQQNGTLEQGGGCTTFTKDGGTATILNGSITTLDNREGDVFYQGAGTITTANVGGNARLDFSRDKRARTITNLVNLYEGATFWDPSGTVTLTAGFKTHKCTLEEVTVNVGNDRTYTVA